MVCQFGDITNSSSLGSAKDSFSSVKTLRNLRYVKYAGLTAWLLALIFIILINVSRSYASNQSDQAGAEAGLSTLATTVTGQAKVGMSDPGDVGLSAIAEGGIVTGGHNLTVSSTSVAGYKVAMESDGALKDDSFAVSESTNNTLIMSTTGGTLTAPAPLTNNSWGVAIVGNSGFDDVAVYQSTDQSVLSKAKFAPIPGRSGDNPDGQVIFSGNAATTGDTRTIYYGVKTDPYFRAGNYSTTVVYTITAELPDTPTITSVTPDSYQLESGAGGQITIEGTNLSSAYSVYLTNASGDTVGDCTNLNVVGDTQLTCTIPTTGISAGDYTIHVVTQGGEASIAFTYEEGGITTISDDTQNVNVAVDKGMIPVTYTGSTTNAQWTSLTTAEIKANPKVWFDYTGESTADGPHWANAVTVKNPEEYIGQHKVVKDSDILGFWAYIPRYAYKVMRRDAVDKPVSPQNFEIRFEKKTDPKKYPAKTCSTGTNHQNYLSCPGVSSEYGKAEGTAWATHPAFTFGDQELDGFWAGKFETSGSTSQPKVLPNQRPLASITIGNYYDIAKSMGILDVNNVYGSNTVTNQNNQNLAVQTSHMITNREYGAVVYLSASSYGAGYDGVVSNLHNGSNIKGSDGNGNKSYAMTGCGPYSENSNFNSDGRLITYTDGGDIGTQQACSTSNVQRAYNGDLGQLASSTNNVYGVYDMAGGANDNVAANLTTQNGIAEDSSDSGSNNWTNAPRPPYVDLYESSDGFAPTEKPSWASSSCGIWSDRWEDGRCYNFSVCTFETCGGQALHETITVQTVTDTDQGWLDSGTSFPTAEYGSSGAWPWMARGGDSVLGPSAYTTSQPMLYDVIMDTNAMNTDYSFRAVLINCNR